MIPIEVRLRPFAIEPITSVMMPDGIFDASLMFQDISFFVTNRSEQRLRFCWVRPDHRSPTDWAYTALHMTEIGPMAPGESRLVRWRANFSKCAPGKRALRIEFGAQIEWEEFGGGFDGVLEKVIFVSRTTQVQGENRFICEVPEGQLQLAIARYSLVPGWRYTSNNIEYPVEIHVPSFPVVEKIIGTVSPKEGFEDAIPFQDPWWKIVAWVIAALAAIGAFIAAKEGKGTASIGVSGDFDANGSSGNWCIPDPSQHPDSENLAGYLSIIATAAIRVGMMDTRDPWQKGRDKFPNDLGDPRLSETVVAEVQAPYDLGAGEVWEVPIEWTYRSRTQSGLENTETRREIGRSENSVRSVNISLPDQVQIGEDLVVDLYIEDHSGNPLLGDEVYAYANFVSPKGHVFRRDLTNTSFLGRSGLGPGKFQAGINTEWAGGQIGWENAKGRWTVELYGQLVNRAPEGATPFDAATYVGGDFLLAPMKLAKTEPSSGDTLKSGSRSCQPDKFLETHVL